MIFTTVVTSNRAASYPGLTHEETIRAGTVRQGGSLQSWYQSTRLAVDYPSMESPALLLPDNDPMDLTHLRLTGMARVGQ